MTVAVEQLVRELVVAGVPALNERVHTDRLPQDAALPAADFDIPSETYHQLLASGLANTGTAAVVVSFHAATRIAAANLARTLLSYLASLRGVQTTAFVQGVDLDPQISHRYQPPIERSDAGRYVSEVAFNLTFEAN